MSDTLTPSRILQAALDAGYSHTKATELANFPETVRNRLATLRAKTSKVRADLAEATAKASGRELGAKVDHLASQAIAVGIKPPASTTTDKSRRAAVDAMKSGIWKQRDARAAIESRQAELSQLRAAAGLPAQAPVKPGPSILGQTHIKQTIADLDGKIAALKTPRPAAIAPKVRPVAAAPVAAAAAAAPGLTREEFNRLPPAARLRFSQGGGKLVEQSDGKTFARFMPPVLSRKAFNSLSPAKRLEHVKSGGKLID